MYAQEIVPAWGSDLHEQELVKSSKIAEQSFGEVALSHESNKRDQAILS